MEIIELLSKIIPVVKSLGYLKSGVEKIFQESPLSRAITATANTFSSELENVHSMLLTWSKSEEFTRILEKLKAGERDLTEEEVISSFIDVTDFYVPEHREARARGLFLTFLKKLEAELYATPEGLALHAEREEFLHGQTRTLVQQVGTDLSARILSLEELLGRLRPDDPKAVPLDQEQALHARVDAARDLIKEGKIKAAQSTLLRLRSEIAGRSISPELQFRIATNLGSCALELDDLDTAKTEFLAALNFQPANPKALANAALISLLDGKPEEALQFCSQARQLEPTDPHPASIYLQALYRSGRTVDLEQFLTDEPWVAEDPVCALVLGQTKYWEEKYHEAATFLRVSLQKDDQNPDASALLAYAIIAPIQAMLRVDPPLSGRFPEIHVLREAETLLTHAIELLQHRDNQTRLQDVLINRAVVRLMMGHLEDALRDCDRVLADNAMHTAALWNKGLALFRACKLPDAILYLEQLRGQMEQVALAPPLAHAYYENNQPEKTIGLLLPLWQPDLPNHDQLRIAHLLLVAYAKRGEKTNVEEILRILEERWPHDPEALALRALQKHLQGATAEGIALLNEALTYAKGHHREKIMLDLADLYHDQRDYAKAVELYKTVVDTNTDQSILRRYLIALYNLGSYQEAFSLAQTIRGSGIAIPVITEIEALILEYMGDVEPARTLRRELMQVDPQNVSHQLRFILLSLKKGDREVARNALNNVHYDAIKDDALTLIQVAELRLLLGMDDILPLAYRARRVGFQNPETHLAYLRLFLRREAPDQTLLMPSEVGINCVVHLKDNGETKLFTILEEGPLEGEQGVLAPTDPLAKKLLGHRKGDRVILREGPLEELSYEIIDIQSQYVFAFQQTLSEFTTWFPDHPGLYKVRIEGNNFAKIFATLDERYKQITQLVGFYRASTLPLSSLAQLVGCSLIEAWAGMLGWKDGRVIAASGSEEDLKKDQAILSGTDAIALDLTALLTLKYLDLLGSIPRRFNRIVIAQAVLDEINKTLANHYIGAQPSERFGKEREGYVYQDVPPESLERERQFLEDIRTFIEAHAEIVPTRSILTLGKERFEQLEAVFGREAICAVLTAKETGVLLYSDDLRLRLVAKNKWEVEGVWSQSVLQSMRGHGLMRDAAYYNSVKKLVLANYHFVALDAETLFWLLEQNTLDPTALEVTRVFESLQGPECTEESAIGVLTNLIQLVWLKALLEHQKVGILDLALKTLITGRPSRRVIDKLSSALRAKLRLMPTVLPTVLQSIDLWRQQRLF